MCVCVIIFFKNYVIGSNLVASIWYLITYESGGYGIRELDQRRQTRNTNVKGNHLALDCV